MFTARGLQAGSRARQHAFRMSLTPSTSSLAFMMGLLLHRHQVVRVLRGCTGLCLYQSPVKPDQKSLLCAGTSGSYESHRRPQQACILESSDAAMPRTRNLAAQRSAFVRLMLPRPYQVVLALMSATAVCCSPAGLTSISRTVPHGRHAVHVTLMHQPASSPPASLAFVANSIFSRRPGRSHAAVDWLTSADKNDSRCACTGWSGLWPQQTNTALEPGKRPMKTPIMSTRPITSGSALEGTVHLQRGARAQPPAPPPPNASPAQDHGSQYQRKASAQQQLEPQATSIEVEPAEEVIQEAALGREQVTNPRPGKGIPRKDYVRANKPRECTGRYCRQHWKHASTPRTSGYELQDDLIEYIDPQDTAEPGGEKTRKGQPESSTTVPSAEAVLKQDGPLDVEAYIRAIEADLSRIKARVN